MSCGVGHRRSLDPTLLWLLCRLAAIAPIRPLAWEPLYTVGAAQGKKKTNKQTNKKNPQKNKKNRKPKTKPERKKKKKKFLLRVCAKRDSGSCEFVPVCM